MFGLDYLRPISRDEARAAFASLATATRPMLIECPTDRQTNVAEHRRIQRAVADALARESLR
jgi:2-succinyl-5-enolpyruvyl-6-hydroxy-3-cyclohexene-1-carboxylate synthase